MITKILMEFYHSLSRNSSLLYEIFYTLKEAQVFIEQWRLEYNTFRPHSSLDNRIPGDYARTELLKLEK